MIETVDCTVKAVGELKIRRNGFRIREMVVVTQEPQPQTLKFCFKMDKADLPESLVDGESVRITFQIVGHEWFNQGTGKYQVSNTLEGISIVRNGNEVTAMPEDYEVDFSY